ncbi:sigma factor-like helix-turn-helix DNA-binding protein, partial [Pseudomonas aeruginosa]
TLVELDRQLDGLPPLAKENFLLAQHDGLGYAEIATQLGNSLSSVKRYMLKAPQRCYFAELPRACPPRPRCRRRWPNRP